MLLVVDSRDYKEDGLPVFVSKSKGLWVGEDGKLDRIGNCTFLLGEPTEGIFFISANGWNSFIGLLSLIPRSSKDRRVGDTYMF